MRGRAGAGGTPAHIDKRRLDLSLVWNGDRLAIDREAVRVVLRERQPKPVFRAITGLTAEQ